MKSRPSVFLIVLLFFLPLTLGSWSLKSVELKSEIPYDADTYNNQMPEEYLKKKNSQPPFDYGDRTQLSAFLLWLLFGFSGAHWFYMKYYGVGLAQLLLSVFGLLLLISGSIFGLLAGVLMLMALNLWLVIDFVLILLRLIRLKNGGKLIPWR